MSTQHISIVQRPTYFLAALAIIEGRARPNTQTVHEQVDQRIAELETEMRTLKHHRILVADTSFLPPEILIQNLHHSQGDSCP